MEPRITLDTEAQTCKGYVFFITSSGKNKSFNLLLLVQFLSRDKKC